VAFFKRSRSANAIAVLLIAGCLVVAGYYGRMFLREVTNREWERKAETDRTEETLTSLAADGDLREIALRLSRSRTTEPHTSETLSSAIQAATLNKHELTAQYLSRFSTGTAFELREQVSEDNARVASVTRQMRERQALTFEDVYVLDQWLSGAEARSMLSSIPDVESLVGSARDRATSGSEAQVLTYRLAHSVEHGGGSGVSIRRIKEYHLRFFAEPNSRRIRDWEILRERKIESDFVVD
jgi:hypothetical protein